MRSLEHSSDLHGLNEAYQGFSDSLKDFDVGVIAGDLLDEYLPDEDLMRMLDLTPGDFLEDPPSPTDTLDDRLQAWREPPALQSEARS